MLETLQQQEDERRRRAGPLATSLLRACAGGNKARERAQVTAHEALRQAKATNPQAIPCSSQQREGNAYQENEILEKIIDGVNSADQLIAADPTSQDVGRGGGGGGAGVRFLQHDEAVDACARPMSKSERLCADLLSAVFHATK